MPRYLFIGLMLSALAACQTTGQTLSQAEQLEVTVRVDTPPLIVAAAPAKTRTIVPLAPLEPGHGRLRWEVRDPSERVIDAGVTGDPRSGGRLLRLSLPAQPVHIFLYDDHGLIGRVAFDPSTAPVSAHHQE